MENRARVTRIDANSGHKPGCGPEEDIVRPEMMDAPCQLDCFGAAVSASPGRRGETHRPSENFAPPAKRCAALGGDVVGAELDVDLPAFLVQEKAFAVKTQHHPDANGNPG